jgi:hypothetical protein
LAEAALIPAVLLGALRGVASVRTRFRLWRYRVWCKRVADRQDEFRNAWTGLDMNDAERRITKALAKQVKWSRRLK